MKSILDPRFKYTDSASTDIRKTFARVRREQAKGKLVAVTTPAKPSIIPIKQRKS